MSCSYRKPCHWWINFIFCTSVWHFNFNEPATSSSGKHKVVEPMLFNADPASKGSENTIHGGGGLMMVTYHGSRRANTLRTTYYLVTFKQNRTSWISRENRHTKICTRCRTRSNQMQNLNPSHLIVTCINKFKILVTKQVYLEMNWSNNKMSSIKTQGNNPSSKCGDRL